MKATQRTLVVVLLAALLAASVAVYWWRKSQGRFVSFEKREKKKKVDDICKAVGGKLVNGKCEKRTRKCGANKKFDKKKNKCVRVKKPPPGVTTPPGGTTSSTLPSAPIKAPRCLPEFRWNEKTKTCEKPSEFKPGPSTRPVTVGKFNTAKCPYRFEQADGACNGNPCPDNYSDIGGNCYPSLFR